MKQEDVTARGLIEVMTQAEREKAAAMEQVPIHEWEVTRVRPDYGTQLTSQALLADSDEAKEVLQVRSWLLKITNTLGISKLPSDNIDRPNVKLLIMKYNLLYNINLDFLIESSNRLPSTTKDFV